MRGGEKRRTACVDPARNAEGVKNRVGILCIPCIGRYSFRRIMGVTGLDYTYT